MSGPLFQCRFNYTHFYLCFTRVSAETLIFCHLSHFSNWIWLCRTAVTREIFEFRTPEQIKGEQNTNYGSKTALSTTTTSKWFQDENFLQWIGCGEGLSCICRIALYCNRFKLQMCTVPSPIHLIALHIWKGVKNVKLRRVWQISLHQWNEHRKYIIHSTTFFFQWLNGIYSKHRNKYFRSFSQHFSFQKRCCVVVLQNSRARREGEFNFNLCNYIAVALSAAARGHGMIARSVTMRTTTTCSVPRSLSPQHILRLLK